MAGYNAGGRREVIALLSFRKDIRHIVALVTPGIHVHRREENPEGRMQHDPATRHIVRDAEPGGELKFVWIVQTFRISLLAADENRGRAVVEYEISVSKTNVLQRTHVFITQPDLNRRITSHLKAVLDESVCVPWTQLHLGNPGLALFYRRQAEQETRQCRTSAVVGGGLGGEAIRELIEAAILKEAPHRPDEIAIAAAQLQTVSSNLPTDCVARFEDRIPGMHRRGDVGVAHSRVALDCEPRRAKCALPAKSNSRNAELGNYVVTKTVFRSAMHRQP